MNPGWKFLAVGLTLSAAFGHYRAYESATTLTQLTRKFKASEASIAALEQATRARIDAIQLEYNRRASALETRVIHNTQSIDTTKKAVNEQAQTVRRLGFIRQGSVTLVVADVN